VEKEKSPPVPKHPKPSNPPPETASQLAVGAKQVPLHRLNLLYKLKMLNLTLVR
jgi:hypothetical protein